MVRVGGLIWLAIFVTDLLGDSAVQPNDAKSKNAKHLGSKGATLEAPFLLADIPDDMTMDDMMLWLGQTFYYTHMWQRDFQGFYWSTSYWDITVNYTAPHVTVNSTRATDYHVSHQTVYSITYVCNNEGAEIRTCNITGPQVTVPLFDALDPVVGYVGVETTTTLDFSEAPHTPYDLRWGGNITGVQEKPSKEFKSEPIVFDLEAYAVAYATYNVTQYRLDGVVWGLFDIHNATATDSSELWLTINACGRVPNEPCSVNSIEVFVNNPALTYRREDFCGRQLPDRQFCLIDSDLFPLVQFATVGDFATKYDADSHVNVMIITGDGAE